MNQQSFYHADWFSFLHSAPPLEKFRLRDVSINPQDSLRGLKKQGTVDSNLYGQFSHEHDVRQAALDSSLDAILTHISWPG